MFDMSNDLEEFLNENVVLPRKDQTQLKKLRKINVNRLKEGLDEYNKEENTNYKIIQDIIQGSVAMFTVIQNEENDYDIDVAVVFDKQNIAEISPLSIRRIVKSALERKTKQLTTAPEVKTSCVRIHYKNGYHVDFAIFRRSYDYFTGKLIYEHAGAEWTVRDIKCVDEWFNRENKKCSGLLRKIVRLSKQYCSLKSSMPSGLIQTALCSECLFDNERLDIAFYQTMKNIYSRLVFNKNLTIPVDGGRSLTTRKIDIERIDRFKNELDSLIKKLDVLNEFDCTREKALKAWKSVFEHDYWEEKILCENMQHSYDALVRDIYHPILYEHTEQFIEDQYPVNERYDVELITTVMNISGFRNMSLQEYLDNQYSRLKHGVKIRCELQNKNKYDYDKILWKVKNEGKVAKQKNMIRGQILKRDSYIVEPCSFYGGHYIECYLIKNDICVGIGHVDIPIER